MVGWNWMINGRENYREIDHHYESDAGTEFDLLASMGYAYNVRLIRRSTSEEIIREAKIEEDD